MTLTERRREEEQANMSLKANSIKKRRKQRNIMTGVLIGVPVGFLAAGLFIVVLLLYCRMGGSF